jgi:hypothetical protein
VIGSRGGSGLLWIHFQPFAAFNSRKLACRAPGFLGFIGRIFPFHSPDFALFVIFYSS